MKLIKSAWCIHELLQFILLLCPFICFWYVLVSFLAGSFGDNMYKWYIEYSAWNFAILDHAVNGGADRFMFAMIDSPCVSFKSNLDFKLSLRNIRKKSLLYHWLVKYFKVSINQKNTKGTIKEVLICNIIIKSSNISWY